MYSTYVHMYTTHQWIDNNKKKQLHNSRIVITISNCLTSKRQNSKHNIQSRKKTRQFHSFVLLLAVKTITDHNNCSSYDDINPA